MGRLLQFVAAVLKREDGALAIRGPFPELRAPADAPGADNFLLVEVDRLKVLTHRKDWK